MTRHEPSNAGLPGWWLLLILPALGALGALGVLLSAPDTSSPAPTAPAVAAFSTPPPVRFETPTPRPTLPPTPTVPPPVVGLDVSDLQFESLDGDTIRLGNLRGQVVFLNVWATWCAPCREEMPLLQAFAAAYSDLVTVIALTDPADGQTLESIRAFVQANGLTLPIALESDRAFYQRWGVQQIPTTFIIDPQGIVRLWHVGVLHEHDLVDYTLALLN